MIEEIFKVIGAGGDVGILAIAFAVFKLDRRVVKIEVENLMKGNSNGR